MPTRKPQRKTKPQGPKIRKPIVDIINELKSWLPNVANTPGGYKEILFRLLASVNGGEAFEDVGYEPIPDIGWHEFDQLGRVIEAIKDKQDVEDIARELMSDDSEELEYAGEAREPIQAPHHRRGGPVTRSAHAMRGRTGAPRRRR